MTELTTKEMRFVSLFRAGMKRSHVAFNAARGAGYCPGSRRGASVCAHRLLRDKRVWEAIFLGSEAHESKCEYCFEFFAARTSVQRFCSKACREKRANERARILSVYKECLRCEVGFEGHPRRFYCSAECRAAGLAEKNELRSTATENPEKRAMWKERSKLRRLRGDAALKALKELGIEV